MRVEGFVVRGGGISKQHSNAAGQDVFSASAHDGSQDSRSS